MARSRKKAKPSGAKIKAAAQPAKKGPSDIPVPPPKRCLNCGHQLHGEYCSHCGQEHIGTGVPGREMLREFFKDEFHLDFRIVRTIIPLLFRPGFIPAEYVAGRRIRYSPPLRTYVFISFILLALITVQAKRHEIIPVRQIKGETEGQQGAVMTREPSSLRLSFPHDTINLRMNDTILTPRQLRDTVLAELKAATDSLQPENSSFNQKVQRGVLRVLEDRERFYEHLLERAAQAMFLLMPIFALLLKLLYLRRRRQYLEHLVFALNVHSHAFLMFVIASAGNLVGWAWLHSWLKWPLLSIPPYLFLAMKKFYRQGWGKTLAKYLLLLGAYAFILMLAGITVLVVSVIW